MAVEAAPGLELLNPAMLIGSERIREGTGGVHEHVNPTTGRVQATVALAGPAEIDRAVAAAVAAQREWRSLPGAQRRDVLLRIAQSIIDHGDELATIGALESGIPVVQGGVAMAAEFWSYYAGWVDKIDGELVTATAPHLDYVLPEPYGVVGVIIPWNGPTVAVAMKVAPALAAGNAVVLKPPEVAPFAALRLAELALEAGLPPGVLNVVPGGPEAGDRLVRHPDVAKVSFTGSIATARRVMAAAAETPKPVALELGGKSANIVFDDADIPASAGFAAMMGVMVLSGQGCVLPTRLLVQRGVYDAVVQMVTSIAGSFTVGDPLQPATLMGPVITEAACTRILRVIDQARDEKQGELLLGGTRLGGELADGWFVPPTIFAGVDNRSPLAQHEVFGPVLSIIPFCDEEEAVALANDTVYGLGAYIHTNDLRRAHRVAAQMQAGYVSVNGFAQMNPSAPFGGYKQSGFGREGGKAGLLEFLQLKNVHISL